MLTNRRSTMMVTPSRTSYMPPNVEQNTEPHCKVTSVLTATTDSIPGHHVVKVVGTVHGVAVFTRKDTKSFLKATASQNEAKALTHAIYNARDQALERLTRDCVSRGGNAVIGVSFNESEIFGYLQVSVSGTAVYVERESRPEDRFTMQ